jgi:hypothetical protein
MFQNLSRYRRKFAILLTATFISLITTCCKPCYADVLETQSFKRVFRKGAVTRYRVTSTSEVENLEGGLSRTDDEFIVTETVVELKADGSTIVTAHVQALKLNGQDVPKPEKAFTNFTIQFDKSGAFKDKKLFADNALAADNLEYLPGVRYPTFGFPELPLLRGAVLKYEIAGDVSGKGKHSVRFKSLGLEKLETGVLTDALRARVDDELTLGGGGGTVDYVWNVYLDPKTGTLLKMTMETNNFPMAVSRSFVRLRTSRVLIPPDATQKTDTVK